MSIIISDSSAGLSQHAMQSWYRAQCAGNGVWVGDGVAEQYELKISKPTSELYGEIGSAFGVLVNKGKYKIAKLLQSHTTQEEGEADE